MTVRARWAAWPLVVALAATPVQAQPRERLAVRVQVDGSAEERTALLASLEELLSRLAVSLALPGEGPVLAQVTVALGTPNCTVAISDRQGTLVTARRLPRGPSTPVTLEAVATVVHATVEALADQARHPAARRVVTPASPSPLPEVAAAAAPASLALEAVELGAFLSLRAFGLGAPAVLGGGLWAAVRTRPLGAWTPRLTLAASWSGPFEAEAPSHLVQVSTQTVSARLFGGVRTWLSPALAFEGSLGLGADLFAVEGRSTALPPGSYDRFRVQVSPLLGALLALRIAVSGTTSLLVALGADLDLMPRRYVLDLQGSREVLFEAWPVRPMLMAGFSFDAGRPM
jgi:hypothetical protein